jgi:glycosyltransferase involved in cell wall biosynthesis
MKELTPAEMTAIAGSKICIVVPAHNEERNIERVVDTMPGFVDWIVIVDDKSTDATAERVRIAQSKDARVVLVQHAVNQGVGGAIASGYEWARDHDMDVAVVMAGDAQMDPADLPGLLAPVVLHGVNYAKGNRFLFPGGIEKIPRVRLFGNAVLSFLTKVASGYWHVSDTQCGYTAIDRNALKAIDWQKMYKRYGQPNDLLVTLNMNNMTVRDVPVKPLYNVGEISGIRIRRVVFTISRLLVRRFRQRMLLKYVVLDFHPLVLFYLIGILLALVSVVLFGRSIWLWIADGTVPALSAIAFMFAATTSLQSFFFAMWMDLEVNKDLKG